MGEAVSTKAYFFLAYTTFWKYLISLLLFLIVQLVPNETYSLGMRLFLTCTLSRLAEYAFLKESIGCTTSKSLLITRVQGLEKLCTQETISCK